MFNIFFNYGKTTNNDLGHKHKDCVITLEYQDNGENYILKSEPRLKGNYILRNISDNNSNFNESNEAIYSSVDINYYSDPGNRPKEISSVSLDNEFDKYDQDKVKRSPPNLSDEIVKLFISIRAQDNNDFTNWARNHKGKPVDENQIDKRMNRFINAFKVMFEDRLWFHNIIDNVKPVFKKKNNPKEIDIYDLSSGEKQIVFRGAFLLKDKKSLNEPLVLIDEPEISLHPKWQEKIFGYYTSLFKDDDGKQTSQIFMTTHSDHVLRSALLSKKTMVIILNPDSEPKIIHSNTEHSPEGFILDTVTTGEIMYKVFGLYTVDFHQALFEHMKFIFGIKNYSNSNYKIIHHSEKWIPDTWENPRTESFLPLYIRNYIDHPRGNKTGKRDPKCLNKEFLQKSIDYMIEKVSENIIEKKKTKSDIISAIYED